MEALHEGRLGRSTSGQHGCRCYTLRQKRAEPEACVSVSIAPPEYVTYRTQ